jgi:DNA repair exonuclease SbcCD ATPase subunit
MKILTVNAQNFQSYRELDFDYSDLGLAIVWGQTGAGKSTMLDAPCWGLFGTTSKEGAADDVRAWDAEGPTTVHVMVELPDGTIGVHRTRGSSKQNDLYWIEYGSAFPPQHPSDPVRGKDLAETQKLLEKRLGVTQELFLVGAYMHQFSKADSFFIAKAKERREVLEKIADQELAVRLGERASEARKEAKREKDTVEAAYNKALGMLETLSASEERAVSAEAGWEESQNAKIETLRTKSRMFDDTLKSDVKKLQAQRGAIVTKPSEQLRLAVREAEKETDQLDADRKALVSEEKAHAQISYELKTNEKELSRIQELGDAGTCPTCFSPTDSKNKALTDHCGNLLADIEELKLKLSDSARRIAMIKENIVDEKQLREKIRKAQQAVYENKQAIDRVAELELRINDLKASKNPYEAQVQSAETETNPFTAELEIIRGQLDGLVEKVQDLSEKLEQTEHRVASLTWLYDKSFELRGLLMQRVVSQIEKQTNDYLERYFDAALRVQLTLKDADKLDVEITNDGFSAPFKQLSGGERCMLKLAFSLSLMKAAQNKAGVSFGTVMLDEPLNGLDEGLKVKAFGLLQELENEYSTVLTIDHSSELRHHFSKAYCVEKCNGYSQVNEQEGNG